MTTAEELRKYFGLKATYSLLKYVKAHLDEINSDGEHAYMNKGSWCFDDTAVKRLEELRGFGVDGGIVDKRTNERLQERDQIIANLQTRLLAEATSRADALEQVAKLQGEMRLLAEAKQAETTDKAVLQKEVELLREQLEELKTDKNNLTQQVATKEAELSAERNRHWWKFWNK